MACRSKELRCSTGFHPAIGPELNPDCMWGRIYSHDRRWSLLCRNTFLRASFQSDNRDAHHRNCSNVYILAERGEDLVLIDQHAAHERILYEQVLKMKKSRVQELITPVTIDLTPKEKVLMEEYIPYLEDFGFGISEFGDNTYVVTFVPEVFGRLEDPEVIHDIVSDLLASGKVKKDTGISEKICKTLACRAAIKGGAACSPRQMEELIEQLKKAENPYSCPHGRPTVITFTKGELDRMFARIQ